MARFDKKMSNLAMAKILHILNEYVYLAVLFAVNEVVIIICHAKTVINEEP